MFGGGGGGRESIPANAATSACDQRKTEKENDED